MKMTCLALLVAGVLGSGAAFAQTCAAPGTWNPDTTGAPPVSVDLCAGSDSVALFCQFLDSSGKNDGIYSITLAAGFTATSIAVSGGSATFNPVTYLYSDACATANACVQSGDATTPLPLTGTTPGTYFLAVTAAASDGAGACGTPQMTTNGTFPVSLQNFSVE
jgi:hypothetical protein